jgi:hypothetical protein
MNLELNEFCRNGVKVINNHEWENESTIIFNNYNLHYIALIYHIIMEIRHQC